MFTTLRAKLLAGFLPFVILLLALGGYAIYSFRSLADITSSGLEQNSESVLANLSMYESLVRLDAAQLRMIAGEVSTGKDVLADEPAQFYLALQKAQRSLEEMPPEIKQTVGDLLVRIELGWEEYQSSLPTFLTYIRNRPSDARKLYDETLLPKFNDLRNLSLSLSEQNYLAFQSARKSAVNRARGATVGVIIVALLSVALGLVIAYLIARRTTTPLRNLTDTVKQLQAGNLNAKIAITGADEIGDLAFEFNRLSERLQQYEAINISEIVREKQKSEAIIESIEDPLLLFDADGQLLLMNKAAELVTGITEQTAIGRPLWQLFRDKKILKDIERAIEQAASAIGKEEYHVPPPIISLERSGRTRYFRLRVARIFSSASSDATLPIQDSSPLVGVLVFFNDITHFKELDKMKSDFIAKVSHEFRTPLTSMTMSLDILGAELLGKLNDEQHDLIRTSKQDANRLAKLIRDLLTLARLESTKQTEGAHEEEINLRESVLQLTRSLNTQYLDKGVELVVEEPEQVVLKIAGEHFASILSNLLSNALKHTPEGGKVAVKVHYVREKRELTIAVADTGIGIAPEFQKRVFDKFVQVKPTNTSTPGSVGLGLAIVTELAHRYGGKVDLQSELGKGSTFTVMLHVSEVVAVPEEEARRLS